MAAVVVSVSGLPVSVLESVLNVFRAFPSQMSVFLTENNEIFNELDDAEAYALSLPVPAIRQVGRPPSVPPPVTIAPQQEGAWVYLPSGQSSNNRNVSNLIVNGNGDLGDNTNFSQFTANVNLRGNTTPVGFVSEDLTWKMIDKSISVEWMALYQLKFWADYFDPNGTYNTNTNQAKFSVAAFYYDQDDLPMQKVHYSQIVNVEGVLTNDLKFGDTTVTITKAPSGLPFDDGIAANRNLGFFNYRAANGKRMKGEGYTRNVLEAAWSTPGDVTAPSANTVVITLRVPYSGEFVPFGTVVKQMEGGVGTAKIDLIVNKPAEGFTYVKYFGGDIAFQSQIDNPLGLPPVVKKVKIGFKFEGPSNIVKLAISRAELTRCDSGHLLEGFIDFPLAATATELPIGVRFLKNFGPGNQNLYTYIGGGTWKNMTGGADVEDHGN
jgi:hypothetical protein